ncbi:hypothetical protein ACNKHV_15530 [Shigella flexneri]
MMDRTRQYFLQAAGEVALPERCGWWMRIISTTQSGGMAGLVARGNLVAQSLAAHG